VRGLSGKAELISCAALVACTSTSGDPLDPLPGSGSVVLDAEYPTGPYGVTVGTIIENFAFDGYVDASANVGEAHRTTFTLGDFYNPDGDAQHGAGSPFPTGSAKPRALMINVSAGWCGPCRAEAKYVLPGEYRDYHPQGMELLMVLADSGEHGVPAGFDDLEVWCRTNGVFYPAVIDPTAQLAGSFDDNQYPVNFIIDTSTMEIVDVTPGAPGATFFGKLEDVLGL
jgi:hypothetical protein